MNEIESATDDEHESAPSVAADVATNPPISDDPALTVRNLEKSYGSGENAVHAVDDVSFSVEHGSVVGLLGPNGAGKTTIIKSVLGLVTPDTGDILVDGIGIDERRSARYDRVGATLEGARNIYWKLSVRENMEFFASLQGIHPKTARDRHDAYLDLLDLADRAGTPVNELSRGMKQKASIACVLAREPSILFLDEPTLGLDVRASEILSAELLRLSGDEGKTVVISSHDMDVIQEVCDRVIILHDGRVISDSAVDELIDLFQTKAYQVAVTIDDPDELHEHLAPRYDVSDWTVTDRTVSFEVTVPDGERLYDLIGDLQTTGAVPVSIEDVEPDMKDAYLHLTETTEERP
ncbi:ABC-type multidrug transport system, ATPase component [Halovivax ruber XH-70]|uniref:ABC-type multidrug transport system, ATPase component n=1 Tax=Halovivax ruber (strain DSM 18193 / JCM 13892 / XH-70) TaxID=797302 RepID=L0IFR4_HALRX|nr:ABC transporter ATP-binding protein [Halovivax ruber]AGB17609.1 ABC-type multidrug transport system, ATPase component [Halovivax ruber XH-70]